MRGSSARRRTAARRRLPTVPPPRGASASASAISACAALLRPLRRILLRLAPRGGLPVLLPAPAAAVRLLLPFQRAQVGAQAGNFRHYAARRHDSRRAREAHHRPAGPCCAAGVMGGF